MQLIKISAEEFDGIYAEMEKNFILAERRDYTDARAMLSNKKHTVYHIEHEGVHVGFLTAWDLQGFTYLEHFVIYEPHRNAGLGARTMALAQQQFGTLLLECEPPETGIAARRLAFYKRCGFVQNDIPYMQPAYRESDGEGIPLVLMSYPDLLSSPTDTVRELYQTAYNKFD